MGVTNVDVLAANAVTAAALTGALQQPVELASANGAIASKSGVVMITKTGALAAMTLAAPVAGTDDGKLLTVVAATAFAHTVTNASPGFNNAGASGDVATFGGAIGDSMQVVAFNGRWHVLALRNVTLA
jgi:hypothetical protein